MFEKIHDQILDYFNSLIIKQSALWGYKLFRTLEENGELNPRTKGIEEFV